MAGSVANRPSRLVAPGEPVLVLEGGPKFVSRGGEKLAAALDKFDVDVKGARALDAGASTGGFTDCLLQRGAESVVALDVGRGQLHERLRNDPRVIALDRTNLRAVTPQSVGGPFDVVTADLSFISLRTVAATLVELVRPRGNLLVLIKPQFEVGRREASRGKGVVRSPELWRSAMTEVIAAFERVGATIMGVMVSPLRGADGNVEFLAHLQVVDGAAPGTTATPSAAAGLIEAALASPTAQSESGS